MSWGRIALLSVLGALLTAGLGGAAPQGGKAAAPGVPLPEGALARVGSLQLRHRGTVQLLTFLPGGRSLLSVGEGEALSVWEVATGKELRRLRLPAIPAPPPRQDRVFQIGNQGFIQTASSGSAIAVSPEGKVLARAGGDGVHLWNLEAPAEQTLCPLKGGVLAVAFSADGKLLAGAGVGEEALVCVWDARTGKEVKRLRPPKGHGVQLLLFAPDGSRLAAGSEGDIRIWDLKSGKRIRTYQGHEGPVAALAFSPNGKRLASASADKTIFLWGEDSEEELGKLAGPEGGTKALAFSPDGRLLASGDGDNAVRLWDVESGRALKVLGPLDNEMGVLAFSPDGKTLAAGGSLGRLHLWDVAKGKELLAAGEAEPITAAAFTDGGRRLTLGAAGGVVCQADPATGKVLRRFAAPGDKPATLMFDPACRLAVFTVEGSSELRLWDVAAGKELRRLKPPDEASLVAVGPRGRWLAIAEGDQRVVGGRVGVALLRLWDVTTGQPLYQLGSATAEVAFAPNGKVVATAAEGGITLWEIATGKQRCRLPVVGGGTACMAFSPNGRWLAAGGGDEVVRLWDVLTGELRRGMVGHTDNIRALAFSPDGKRLASGSADQTVILWDLATGEPQRRLEGHRGVVQALAFAPDGKRLVSASDDTTAVVWDLEAPQRPRPPKAVRPLEALWANLGRDAGPAFAAHRALAARPVEAVSFLSEKLLPVPATDPAVISRLIKELNSRRFTTRARAMRQLTRLEGQAERALRQALAHRPSAEAAKRLQELLSRLERPVLSPEELRAMRALELLEQLDTPAARRLLRLLAGGAAGARLTREAQEALARGTAHAGAGNR